MSRRLSALASIPLLLAAAHGLAQGVGTGTASILETDVVVTVPATSGTYTQVLSATAPQIATFQQGMTYIDIHTAVFPGGEIRAQDLSGGLGTGSANVTPVELQRFEVE